MRVGGLTVCVGGGLPREPAQETEQYFRAKNPLNGTSKSSAENDFVLSAFLPQGYASPDPCENYQNDCADPASKAKYIRSVEADPNTPCN
jgi:hypothetical protein